METKALWQSKTFWGVIISGLAGLLGIWGKGISPADQQTLVEVALTVAGVIGSILAIVGRITAKTKISNPPAAPLALMLLLALACLAAGGCTGLSPSVQSAQAIVSPQEAVDLGAKLAKSYFAVHDAYNQLLGKADSDLAHTLKRNVAPALNKTKYAIIAYNDVALLYMQSSERPADIAAMFSAARTLLADCTKLIQEVKK